MVGGFGGWHLIFWLDWLRCCGIVLRFVVECLVVVWLDFADYGLTGWDCLVIVIWLMVLGGVG